MIQTLLYIIQTLLTKNLELESVLRKKEETLSLKSGMLEEFGRMLDKLMNENDSFEKEIITLKKKTYSYRKKN
jgi:hypothetical protein